LAAQREAEASKIELTRSASTIVTLQTSLDVNQKSLSALVADLKSTTQATTESQRDATAAYTKQLNQLIDDNARLKVEADKLRSELESARKATASGLPAKS
jgi:regulator of replication initiation timing